MKLINLVSVTSIMLISSTLTVCAHDSHTHTAPWQACEQKQKTEQCAYTNGDEDLFKGSCQLFSDKLMCVRNEPIIHAKKNKQVLDDKLIVGKVHSASNHH